MNRRGFSLAESILTLFMVFLVLGLAADQLGQYCSVLNFSAGKDNTFLATQVALHRMVQETRESISLQSPTTGVANDLSFQRIDPAYTPWLPIGYDPATSTPPGSWNAYPAASLLSIRYSVASGQLLRTTTFPSAATDTEILASWITDLQTSVLASREIQIQLFCQESSRVSVLTATVLRPIP